MTEEVGFEELYRTHYARVFGLCRQLLGSADRAEDAADGLLAEGDGELGELLLRRRAPRRLLRVARAGERDQQRER